MGSFCLLSTRGLWAPEADLFPSGSVKLTPAVMGKDSSLKPQGRTLSTKGVQDVGGKDELQDWVKQGAGLGASE